MPADPLAWETLESDVAYTCPGFDIITQTVRLPDGERTDFDFLSEPPSVCILPFTNDGDVVCIEEWRQAVGRLNHGLPVGTTEPDDEDLETAARRELREETGHEATTIERLVTVEPANGLADSVMHFFVARGCAPTGEQQLDADESIRVAPQPYDDLLEAVRAGDVRDGRTVLAVSHYELRTTEAQ
ncbi:NUDIX hydrolase [Natrialbaceae archaeon A-CW2]|uniref:NUDIX hydrolase n=1 Tax=Natronosalvus amylolyticus TaxID=2961994 RepID=UPI0020CA24EC|nr:NUDIX hydrolase [Natronosalvus amylolyticus]